MARAPVRSCSSDLGGQVDVGEHVAVEHQEAFVEHRLGELQRAGGAARVGLLDEAQADPEPGAVAEHVANAGGEEAAGHDDVLDAVHTQPFEHVRDEGPVDQRHDGLRDRRGQRPQAGALAADEDHGLHSGPPAARRRSSCAAICARVRAHTRIASRRQTPPPNHPTRTPPPQPTPPERPRVRAHPHATGVPAALTPSPRAGVRRPRRSHGRCPRRSGRRRARRRGRARCARR